MEVGIRELKQQLSHWLDRVEAGELVTITDRGRPKALLVPVPGNGELERGIEEGWIRAPSGQALRPFTPVPGDRRTSDVLDEDRGD